MITKDNIFTEVGKIIKMLYPQRDYKPLIIGGVHYNHNNETNIGINFIETESKDIVNIDIVCRKNVIRGVNARKHYFDIFSGSLSKMNIGGEKYLDSCDKSLSALIGLQIECVDIVKNKEDINDSVKI